MALDLAFLKKKAGPLTYGEWAAVVSVSIVIVVWYRRKHGATTADPNAATPDPTGSSQLSGGGSLGGSVPTGGVPGADNPPTTTDSGSSGVGGTGGWLDPGNTNTGGTSNTGGSSGGFLGDNTPASGAGGIDNTPSVQGTYVVKNGDNWITVAAQFGVSESDLLAVNANRGPSALKSGETIYLPAGAHLGGSSGTGSGVVGYYTVGAGDNWITVASRAGVSESALLAANASRGPGALRAGDQLAIPSGGHVPTASTGSSGSSGSSGGGVVGYYTVGGGDNWLNVASRAGVSESALLAANASRGPSALKVGDRLAIPSGGHVPAASNTTKNTSTPGKTSAVSSYTVKAGDNWLTVAARFGESEAQLLADNASRGPSALRAGNVLKVRG